MSKYHYIFHHPTKIIRYSYIISKKERDIGSTFVSAYNDKHYNFVNSSLGYLA